LFQELTVHAFSSSINYYYSSGNILSSYRGKGNVAKLTYDKHSTIFKLSELNYLLTAITILENQLARYYIAQNDVMTYVTTALGSQVYVQPRPGATTYVVFEVYLMN
jgi:hypothetical protein